jgi:hypothetical protein
MLILFSGEDEANNIMPRIKSSNGGPGIRRYDSAYARTGTFPVSRPRQIIGRCVGLGTDC